MSQQKILCFVTLAMILTGSLGTKAGNEFFCEAEPYFLGSLRAKNEAALGYEAGCPNLALHISKEVVDIQKQHGEAPGKTFPSEEYEAEHQKHVDCVARMTEVVAALQAQQDVENKARWAARKKVSDAGRPAVRTQKAVQIAEMMSNNG